MNRVQVRCRSTDGTIAETLVVPLPPGGELTVEDVLGGSFVDSRKLIERCLAPCKAPNV